MTLKSEHTYYKVKNHLIKEGYIAEVGPVAFAIESFIASYTNFRTKKSWPTQETIANGVGINKNTLAKHLSVAIKHGRITKEKRRVKNGRFTNNTYKIGQKSAFFWKDAVYENLGTAKNSKPSKGERLLHGNPQAQSSSNGNTGNKINQGYRLTNKTHYVDNAVKRELIALGVTNEVAHNIAKNQLAEAKNVLWALEHYPKFKEETQQARNSAAYLIDAIRKNRGQQIVDNYNRERNLSKDLEDRTQKHNEKVLNANTTVASKPKAQKTIEEIFQKLRS